MTEETDQKTLRVLEALKSCGDQHAQRRYAKEALAALLAGGNDDLAEALFLTFDEVEEEINDESQEGAKIIPGTAREHGAPPGWPEITRGEQVVFKDHWCTVYKFTKHGVELAIGQPTAALIKRVGKRTAKQLRAQNKKTNRGKKRGPTRTVSLKPCESSPEPSTTSDSSASPQPSADATS